MTFYQYMFLLGSRNEEYKFTPDQIFDNIKYFKDCHKMGLGAYKSLECFSYHLNLVELKKKNESIDPEINEIVNQNFWKLT